jgi:hypothetical protein
MNNSKSNKGFSGLSDLVSEVDSFDSQSVETKKRHHEQTDFPSPDKQRNVRKNKPSSSKFKWMILIVVFFLLIVIVTNGEQLSSLLNLDAHPSQQKAGASSSKVKGQSSSQGLKAELHCKIPPVGRNNLLSVTEIRWCLREDIRIEAMRDFFYTNEAIDEFNRIVENYNCRCGSYQYRGNTQSQAERDVAPFREKIVHAAIQEAMHMENRYQNAPIDSDQRKVIDTRLAQKLLKDLGYNPGPVDGMYGKRTETAIKRFQLDNGKLQDGLISPGLLRDLLMTKK